MNRFKVIRHMVECSNCHRQYSARKVIVSRTVQPEIEAIGFTCSYCGTFTVSYYDTPLTKVTRNNMVESMKISDLSTHYYLRKAFREVFEQEQERVIRTLAGEQEEVLI